MGILSGKLAQLANKLLLNNENKKINSGTVFQMVKKQVFLSGFLSNLTTSCFSLKTISFYFALIKDESI